MLHGITINLHLLFFSILQPFNKLFKTNEYFLSLILLVIRFDKFPVWTPIDSGLPGIFDLL